MSPSPVLDAIGYADMPQLAVAPFLHPTIAAGALGLALIPVLIHLINRRRHRKVPWAAMRFLLAAKRGRARRVRIEQFLLLALRMAVIVLFGLGIARPYLSATTMPVLGDSRVHRIIILDNSLSMSATTTDAVAGDEAATRFRRARRCALRLLDSFSSTDGVSIVTTATPATPVIGRAAFDRRQVRDRMGAIEPSHRGTDAVGALTAAIDILRDSPFPPANRAVYVVSDFPRTIWRSVVPSQATAATLALTRLADTLHDPATDLTVINVAREARPNLAITRMDVTSSLVGVRHPIRVTTEVVNHSRVTSRNLFLQIRRDGQIIRRDPLPVLQPGATTLVHMTTEFSRAGTRLIEARITGQGGDALAVDDSRYLSIDVVDGIPVLLVEGRRGSTALDGDAAYLATALAPSLPGEGTLLVSPKVIAESELAGESLADYSAVVLCNVGRMSRQTWQQLGAYVEQGGGLQIYLGDRIGVDHYNRFGFAEGAGLIPARLRSPVDAMQAATETSDAVTFELERPLHVVVAEFDDHLESGLFTARVDRYFPLNERADRSDVVLRYSNGDVALLASSFGRGRVLLWTTTANMDWTNLPARGDFVSIALSAISFLAPPRGAHRNLLVGGSILEPLTPTQSALPLSVLVRHDTPGGSATVETPALVPYGDMLAMRYGPIEVAMPVTLTVGKQSLVFAVNTDPAESDLETVDLAVLVAETGLPIHIGTSEFGVEQVSAAQRSKELARVALGAVVMLLLVEMWTAMRLGSHRAVAATVTPHVRATG